MATPAPSQHVGRSAQQQGRFPPRMRNPSLEKYRRVEKPREATPDDEIRVMGSGRVIRYVNYATKLLKEQEKVGLTIRATGKAVSIAVSVCEVIKRRFKGLHQVTSIGWTDIVDEYEPLEAGLEPRSEKRSVPSISVFLTKDESKVDKTAAGYQVPLDEALVEERYPESYPNNAASRPPRRQNRRRRGAPRRLPLEMRESGAEGVVAQGATDGGEPAPAQRPAGDTQKPYRRRAPRKQNRRAARPTDDVPAGTAAAGAAAQASSVPAPGVIAQPVEAQA